MHFSFNIGAKKSRNFFYEFIDRSDDIRNDRSDGGKRGAALIVLTRKWSFWRKRNVFFGNQYCSVRVGIFKQIFWNVHIAIFSSIKKIAMWALRKNRFFVIFYVDISQNSFFLYYDVKIICPRTKNTAFFWPSVGRNRHNSTAKKYVQKIGWQKSILQI